MAGRKLNLNSLRLLFFYLLFFIVPLLAASIYGNEMQYIIGALKVYLFFPVLLVLIFQMFDRERLQKIIYNSGVVALVIITITALSTFLQGLGYFPINLNAILYKDEDRIGLNDGFVHIINSPLSYYLFLVPVVFNNPKDFSLTNKKLYFFLLLMIFAVISGRRILLLPFILVIIYHFRRFYKILIPLLVLLLLLFSSISDSRKFENFDPSQIFTRFEDAINNRGDSALREEQTVYFNKYIAEKPIAGYGLGAYMGSYLRNDEFKTAYEKSYHYLVFSMGIPFALLLFVYYLYLIRNSWKAGTGDYLNRGIMIGIISLLFASYTNPYWLSSFDYTIPFALLITFSSIKSPWKKYTVQS